MNDRSKDCAPRGTLRGSWGSFPPPLLSSDLGSLSHTVGTRHQLVVVQGFFYVLGFGWWHADPDGLGGKGKSAGSQARRQWKQSTLIHVSTIRTVSHSSMVCSHCIAQTYACLLRSSFSGCVALPSFSAVALSGCCAPMLPLRGCRVSMRALAVYGGGEE
jgi:hypothetical protein